MSKWARLDLLTRLLDEYIDGMTETEARDMLFELLLDMYKGYEREELLEVVEEDHPSFLDELKGLLAAED